MKFSIKNLKKNLIVAWGFSYILVIAIMLIVTFIISLIYTSTSKNILNAFNNYIFKTVSYNVNNTLISMNNTSVNISQNQHLTSVVLSNSDINQSKATLDFIDDLSSYQKYSEGIENFFVYNKVSDTIISPFGVFKPSLYFETHFDSSKMSFDEWKKTIIDFEKHTQYVDMPYKPYKNANEQTINAIAMLYSIPYSTENELVGVVLADKNSFFRGLEEINWDNICDIYIYNSAGELVTYSKHSSSGEIPMTIKQLAEEYKTEGNDIHTTNIDVSGHMWQVVTVVSDNALSQSIIFAQGIIICIIIASLIVLSYAVKNILNKNYRPIKTMLSFFNITETENEYEHLFNSINKALNQNRSLEKELDSHSKRLKELNLAKLLRGELVISPQEDYGFTFKGENFAVLIFHLENISDLFSDEPNMTETSKLSYLIFIVDNVISEIMEQKKIMVYSTEIDEQVVCLLNSENPINIEETKSLAEQGCDFINRSFDINLTFSLSASLTGVLNIPVVFSQAQEVLEHKRMLGIEEPMQYIDNSSFKSNYIFDLYKEQVLINSIKTGNSEASLEFLKQIFDEIESQNYLPFDYIIYVVLDIACTITKTANSILPSGIDYSESLVFYRKIKNGENLTNLYTQMSEYIETLCETIKIDLMEGKNRTHFLVSHIEKYVSDNYADPNMTVYSIGTYFNVKPYYISNIFKKEVGKPLLTYITNFRIEKALELTKKGKYSKKEIAKMVGFTSERNFYRILKKYEEENSNDEEL